MHVFRFVFFAVLLPALSVPVAFGEMTSAPAYPPHTIPGSQLRVLPVTADGRHYQLHVGLPASYGQDPGKRYPVVFVTDAYWDFEKLETMRGALFWDKYVPEFIIVGLGYAGENLNYDQLRQWDLSPVANEKNPKNTGHAADFLRTIETDIIPYVDREFRTDPAHRVLAGASLGGLFTLYSMYTKPTLFSAYIAVTPAVLVGHDWLLGYEEAFAKSGQTLKGRLFVSVSTYEWPNYVSSILHYNSRLAERKYPDLAYQFYPVQGLRHAGMQIESYVRGLTFVFAPLAAESGPLPELVF
jgi:predicted alpha/beta superfamily hydrolase